MPFEGSDKKLLRPLHALSDHDDFELLFEHPNKKTASTTQSAPKAEKVNDLADAVSLFKSIIDHQFASLVFGTKILSKIAV